MGGFRSVSLWGPDHTELGVVAVETLDPNIAIALSRGKYPKGYPHVDPNEDAVLAATDGETTLLAVADGHDGFDAASGALRAVEEKTHALLSATDPRAAIGDTFISAQTAALAALDGVTGDRAASATALTIAVVSQGQVVVGSMGDARLVVLRGTHARPIDAFAPFLNPHVPAPAVALEQAPLHPGDRVLLATDGLFDFLGPRGPRKLASEETSNSPADLVVAATELAAAGGGGDNIAVAVVTTTG